MFRKSIFSKIRHSFELAFPTHVYGQTGNYFFKCFRQFFCKLLTVYIYRYIYISFLGLTAKTRSIKSSNLALKPVSGDPWISNSVQVSIVQKTYAQKHSIYKKSRMRDCVQEDKVRDTCVQGKLYSRRRTGGLP